MADDDVPGIDDVPRLGRWLQRSGITATEAPPRVRLIAGGRSNLTYLLEPGDEAAPLVLRGPPLGHVLPTAHDMSREYRVLSALAGTEVPVPDPVALYPEPNVIGAPFYLIAVRARAGAAQRRGRGAAHPAPGPAAVRRLHGHAGRDSRGGPGPDRAIGFGPPRGTWNGNWLAAEAVGAARQPGGARVHRTHRAARGRVPAWALPAPHGTLGTATTGRTTRWSRWPVTPMSLAARPGPHRVGAGTGRSLPWRRGWSSPGAGPRLLDGAGRR